MATLSNYLKRGPWREDELIIVGDEAFTPAEWAAVPHGTPGGYWHYGCRCEACLGARREVKRLRKRDQARLLAERSSPV